MIFFSHVKQTLWLALSNQFYTTSSYDIGIKERVIIKKKKKKKKTVRDRLISILLDEQFNKIFSVHVK